METEVLLGRPSASGDPTPSASGDPTSSPSGARSALLARQLELKRKERLDTVEEVHQSQMRRLAKSNMLTEADPDDDDKADEAPLGDRQVR